MMEDFQSETDSDYTSYWRDWVRTFLLVLHTHYSLAGGHATLWSMGVGVCGGVVWHILPRPLRHQPPTRPCLRELLPKASLGNDSDALNIARQEDRKS